MFIDSSVIVEILIDGDKANELLSRMADSRSICTGPTVIYESATVLATRLGRHPDETKLLIQCFVERFEISVLPASYEVASAAIDAFARYGKGRHPAKLNFGDCFSYAGARQSGLPLLYVGGDFARTDLA
ncbi:type II toxin-antitoxin system VapC family toxin [Rhizobium sp. CFBP 13726]|uniref:type II toxin-antitoxin system VapC family toxin n=1 Tax=Rhizobium/Agrobacterium group TaxID=227290 RepID=UPI0017800294|nr:type II toxin-antitoxin system VapC family toxin [Rhizobium sp. CFBP 13726]MBD8649962.1 type II toxin-antitoxin system VapC family toxin [Rhizobium sp. CFBP 13726]